MRVWQRRAGGFTLIELMVVITIIGIMAGLISLSVVTGDPAKEAQREAQRFINVMSLALDQAAFNQQDMGLQIEEDQYRFLVWGVPPLATEEEQGQEGDSSSTLTALGSLLGSNALAQQPEPVWQFVADEPSMELYELPEDIVIDIEISDSELLQSDDGETELTETNLNLDEIGPQVEEQQIVEPPQVYILSSGEIAPSLRLGFYHVDKPDMVYYVVGDEMGRVGFEKDEFDEDL